MKCSSVIKFVLAAFCILLLCSCSGGSSDTGGNDGGQGISSGQPAPSSESSCANDADCDGLIDSIDAAPESGDVDKMRESKLFSLKSFDGSKINCKLLLPAGKPPYPCIMFGHGWAMYMAELEPRAKKLQAEGYACLLWDARGWGESEGVIRLDLPESEVRDIIMIINWLGSQSFVIRQNRELTGDSANLVDFDFNGDGIQEKDEIPGDERNDFVLGLMGRSYGGAASLLAASFDRRIDAVIPEITWNNLRDALYPDSLKKLWALGFYVMGAIDDSGIDSNLSKWIRQLFTKNETTQDLEDGFELRSPSSRIGKIRIPCMMIQGELDTVFEINQAVNTFESIRENGQPAKMYWAYGGHDTMPLFRDEDAIMERITLWMDKYLKGLNIDTGPEFEYDVRLPDDTWTIEGGSWPVADIRSEYYLHAGDGKQGTLVPQNSSGCIDYSGEGVGSDKVLSMPIATSISDIHSPVPDVILYDPPATTHSYLTSAFAEDTEIVGKPVLDIWLSTDSKDITFYFKLIDVAPDDSKKTLLNGYFLKGFSLNGEREGADLLLSHPVKPLRLKDSQEIKQYPVVLPSIAHYVRKGHRIKLVVATSDFSFMNSRAVGNGFIWHDEVHQSRLSLPVIHRD